LIEKRILFGIKDGVSSPYIPINSDWQSYYSKRSKKFREVLNNKANRLKRIGTITIQEFNNCDQDGDLMAKIFEIGRRSWKEKEKIAISSSKDNRNFFSELSKIASQKGWLSIWLLNLNGQPIAFEYHVKYKGKVYALRAAYIVEYQEVSPGSVLDKYIIEHLFRGDFAEYDLGPGVVFYKMRWTSQVRDCMQFMIFKENIYSFVLYQFEFKIIPRIKKSKLLATIKNIRSRPDR